MQIRSEEFVFGNEVEWQEVGPGVKRQIMAYDDKILLVKVSFEKGGIGPLHQHYHSQVTYVESGAFQVMIAGERKTLRKGDAFYIPSDAVHGAVCSEPGILIDVFSPIREDFFPDIKQEQL